MMGYTGKSIATDLGFPLPWLGWLFSISTLGTAAGTFLIGLWGDRFGRVRMMTLSCVVAGVFIGLCITARDFSTLLVLRSIAGFGLGGALPCLIAMSIAAVPFAWRRTMAALIYAALPAGALVGALGSAPLVAAFGWRSVFICAAVALGLIAAAAALVLHEPGRVSGSAEEQHGQVASLFVDGRGPHTAALWAFFLFVGPGLILFGLWMPTLLQMMGTTPAQASLLAACLNVGAVVASVGVGWLVNRFSVLAVFGPMLVIGALGWPVMAMFHDNLTVLLIVASIAGCAMGGVITGAIALAAAYPSAIQATSIGSAVAIARIGQVVAPLIIGLLLAAGWTPRLTLEVCAAPAVAAFAVLLVLQRLAPAAGAEVDRVAPRDGHTAR